MCRYPCVSDNEWQSTNEWEKNGERTNTPSKIKGEIIAILKCHPVMTVFCPTSHPTAVSFVRFFRPSIFIFHVKHCSFFIFFPFATRFCRFFLSLAATEFFFSLFLSFHLWPDYFWHAQYKNEALSRLNSKINFVFQDHRYSECIFPDAENVHYYDNYYRWINGQRIVSETERE